MRHHHISTVMLLTVGVAAGLRAAPSTSRLVVLVDSVRNTNGMIHVDICTEKTFLMPCPYTAEARAKIGTTAVVLEGVPKGRYAAQVFHDENGNHQVDRALFGVPKEGVGFSNDFKIGLRAPNFSETAFSYDGDDQKITVHLRYFLKSKAH